jgi:hypothetical protein
MVALDRVKGAIMILLGRRRSPSWYGEKSELSILNYILEYCKSYNLEQ